MGGAIDLGGTRTARRYWRPFVGHGIVFVPTAVAITSDGNATLVVSSSMELEQDPDALDAMEALLRAVDARMTEE